MSFLDPRAESQAVEDAVLGQIKTMFPYEGRKNTLILRDLRVGDSGGIDDIRGQKQAKLKDRTWASPVYADLELRTSEGKVVDRAEVKLLSLPRMTSRMGYIVDGRESQISYQWHLRAGAYSRVKENGELETQFNIAGADGFAVEFDPKSRKYLINYAKRVKVPLYPVLQALGVSDTEMGKAWGQEIADANRTSLPERDAAKLYKAMHGALPENAAQAHTGIREVFNQSRMYGDVNAMTLGAPVNKVDGQALLLASNKLLGISRGTHKPDNRDALHFKDLWGLEDYLPKRLVQEAGNIRRRLRNNLDRRTRISEIVGHDVFNKPVASLFSTALAEQSHQINPIEMLSGQRRTTIMGPMGGVQSAHAVTDEARLVDESHLGFLDPVPTPEGEKAGITSYLPIGTSKKGLTPVTPMFNLRTGRLEEVTPERAVKAVVAFPDQYNWEGGKPRPIHPQVKVSGKGNELDEVDAKEVDYVLPSAQGLFTLSTNLIPFLQNDQGNRTNYASKQISQAITLKHREAPLVQVHTGVSRPDATWEKVLGKAFSARSPADGMVMAVGEDFLKIRGKDKKTYEVPLYHNYPLNDGKSGISSEVAVKKGQEVQKGQLLADTSFTRDGTLALGVTARVGYLPLRSITFEDAVVISESLAKKLASEHLYQERLYAGREVTLSKRRFRAEYPSRLTDAQAKKLDDDGVIQPGMVVEPGDTLVAALRKGDPSKEQLILRGIHKMLTKPYKDASLTWDHDQPGVVAEVVRNGREVKVHVKTIEPAKEGDKLAGRHGNKGVVGRILPDEEMPHDKEGKPIDIALNPVGVLARINPGQILETLLGKVAHKTGEAYAVTNFAADPDKRIVRVKGHWRTVKDGQGGEKKVWVKEHERTYFHLVQKELEAHGLTDREPLFDPLTGEELADASGEKGILTGYQYLLKLEHTASKGLAARGQGTGFDYDANMGPKGGGEGGGQRIGFLGLYAMLAHGDVTGLLREMSTVKSDRSQDEFWAALQAGEPLPPPKAPFAYEKFLGYLNALGVNVDKKGHELQLLPMTDKDILEKSNGAIELNKVVRGKDLKPEKGGLFDEDITGGFGGSGFAHATLPEPMPNPLFEKAIAALTGLNLAEYTDLIEGQKGLTRDGKLVEAEEADLQGGSAIEHLLQRIDVARDLPKAEAELKTATKSRLDELNKRVKYLRVLKKLGARPEEVYLLRHLPVLPPKFHPLGVLESGDLNVDDLNGIYQQLGGTIEQLRTFPDALPPEYKNPLRAELYDGLKSLAGLGGSMNSGPHAKKGILDIITGSSPKTGYFQNQLLQRKQDLSMRGVIVPAEGLGLDEVGLPREAAMVMFKPFIVRDLVKLGYSPLEAKEEVDRGSPTAQKSLESVVRERPVLLKRDPALHKFSIMAYKANLIEGKSIQLHPLATGGFGADYDGDKMSVYVPVTDEAVQEAWKMLPSKNIFNPATGTVMYQPTIESQIGLYLATRWGDDHGRKFGSAEELLKIARAKSVPYDEVVTLGSQKTTAGRVLVNSLLPQGLRGGALMRDPKFELDKGHLQELMVDLAQKHPGDFAKTMDALKDVGFNHSYRAGLTLSMRDLQPLTELRDRHLAKADQAVQAARVHGTRGEALNRVRIQAFSEATQAMSTEAKKLLAEKGNLFYRMGLSGAKPSWDQVRQMIIAPILLQDGKDKTIPIPVRHSYAEGLDVSEYWVTTHGARKGIMDKTLEVSEPGALNKKISAVVLNMTVTEDDCGTKQGIALDSMSRDSLDRFTAAPIKLRNGILSAGTLITPEVQSTLRASGAGKILVRSPLRCKSREGMCAKCFGVLSGGKPPKLRENIGMIAGQSVGERAVQLQLKKFHGGGVATAGKGLSGLDRLKQVLNVPETLIGSATLSEVEGSVQGIQKDPAGGWRVQVGPKSHYVPQDRGEPLVKKGDSVRKGQPVSSGPVNPRELLELTNIETVQNYLTSAMEETYKTLPEKLRRRNFEVIAKAMTNVAIVEDSGDHPEYLRGDLVPTSRASSWNRENPGRKPLQLQPVLKGLQTLPLSGTEDWMARMGFERLKDTIREGTTRGWKSDLHGSHPVPGLVVGAEFGKPPKDKPWAY